MLTVNQVEAKNLKPFTQYWYQFNICGSKNYSPIGRTKTTPKATDNTTNVGLAIYSCSNYRMFLPLLFNCVSDSSSVWLF